MSPASWYYTVQNRQSGPIAESDLRAMLLAGEIPVDTMVWSEGMANWVSAEKVAELYRPAPTPPQVPTPVEHVFKASPASAGAHPLGNGSASRAGGVAQSAPKNVVRTRQAWNRFLARITDGFFFSLLFGIILDFGVQEDPSFLDAAFATAFSLGLFAFVEAFFLSRWGMTPGKWVFRIRVVHHEQRLLTYPEALRRAFQVLSQGMFFGIPPMVLIFEALAFKELVDRGETLWDKRLQCEVQHASMRGIHHIVAVSVCLCMLIWAFAVVGNTSV